MVIISTMNPLHAYFEKGWNPNLRQKRQKEVKYFDNTNQFLTGIPKLGLETKGRANMVTKKPRVVETPEMKLAKIQKRRAELKKEMQSLIAENNEVFDAQMKQFQNPSSQNNVRLNLNQQSSLVRVGKHHNVSSSDMSKINNLYSQRSRSGNDVDIHSENFQSLDNNDDEDGLGFYDAAKQDEAEGEEEGQIGGGSRGAN